MSNINLEEDHEPIYDLMCQAKEALDKLPKSRTVSLATTSLQQSMLWLLSTAIADALAEEAAEEITGEPDATR